MLNPFIKSVATLFFCLFLFQGLPAYGQVSGEAFSGFQSDSDDPVQIDADELEVIDGKNMAIFKGNVTVKQGVSTLKTSKLIVTYRKGGGNSQSDIDQLDMEGGLVVTSADNVITADKGTYFVKKEQVILTGKVVVAQGENIAKGNKLVANLKTSQAVLSGGRVRSIFTPSTRK